MSRHAGLKVCLAAIILLPLGCTEDATLASRIQKFEDKDEIRNLLLEYGRSLDNRDWEAYSHLFAVDGEWIGGFGTVQGPPAIQAFMEENIGTEPNTAQTYHLLSNFVIDVDGDTATAWSRWAFVTPGPGGRPVIAQGGRYDDLLTREDGRWRFQRREAKSDIPLNGP